MNAKNKVVALVEIAIVLCSVFLVALPGIAADQKQEMQEVSTSEITTTSEDDFVLGIYGNANEDDTIDMRDYTYAARIICWLEEETTFADANYDGRISVADMTQIGLIILERESELTIIDGTEKYSQGDYIGLRRTVTVKKPVERIIPQMDHHVEAIKIIGAEDKAVAVGERVVNPQQSCIYPVMSELPSIGHWSSPDYELIASLNPDIVFMPLWGPVYCSEMEDKLKSLDIMTLCFAYHDPDYIVDDFKILGYIFNKKEDAEEFIDWYEGYTDEITARVEGLSEHEKPKVYIEWGWMDYMAGCKGSGGGQACTIAGGINVAHDLGGETVEVDPEWILEQDPDIIIKMVYRGVAGHCIDDTTEIIATGEEMISRPGWENLKAVKNGNVYIITRELFISPRVGIATAYFAKWFHPELFEDLDPKALHQEYLDRFQRIDYDLDEHGIFVYPPIEIDGGLAGIPDKWL